MNPINRQPASTSGSAARPARRSGIASKLALWLLLSAAFTLGLAPARAVAQSGKLTVQQLGDALTSFGKNTVNNNGNIYYTVNCQHGAWKGTMILSLSPNGNVIWMTIDPVQMPAHPSAAALNNLLKKNLDIGPMFFAVNGEALRISYPVPNWGLSEATLKDFVNQLISTTVDTMPLWDQKTLAAN